MQVSMEICQDGSQRGSGWAGDEGKGGRRAEVEGLNVWGEEVCCWPLAPPLGKSGCGAFPLPQESPGPAGLAHGARAHTAVTLDLDFLTQPCQPRAPCPGPSAPLPAVGQGRPPSPGLAAQAHCPAGAKHTAQVREVTPLLGMYLPCDRGPTDTGCPAAKASHLEYLLT